MASTAAITMRVGAKFSAKLPESTLKLIFALAMMGFAPVIMIKSYLKWKANEEKEAKEGSKETTSTSVKQQPNDVKAATETKPVPSLASVLASFPQDLLAMKDRAPYYLALGSAVGFATGLFGFGNIALHLISVYTYPSIHPSCAGLLGGGLLMTTTLTLAGEMSQQAVLGTCLATLILPGIVGSITHYNMGTMRVKMVPALSLGVFIGATLGSLSALGLNDDALRIILSTFLFVTGTRSLLQLRSAKRAAAATSAASGVGLGVPAPKPVIPLITNAAKPLTPMKTPTSTGPPK
jgi:uncharacterized membrane protein YfcA